MSPSLGMPKKNPKVNSDSISSEPGWFSWQPNQLCATDTFGKEIDMSACTSLFQGHECKEVEVTFSSTKTMVFILEKGLCSF